MSTEEIVEEVVETVEGVYLPKSTVATVGFFCGLAVVGAAYAGYRFGVKQTSTKYEAVMQKELDEAKAFYARMYKKEDFSTPEDVVDKLHPDYAVKEAANAVIRYQGGETEEDINDEEPVEVVENVNVFLKNQVEDGFDFEEEMNHRSPDKPYIIHEQEFNENDPEYEKISITFYEGDGVLADDADDEIPAIEEVVGRENLDHFGHGSGDDRILYIRNEHMSTDFEVLRHDGKYAHEVLGFEHSDGGPRARQRANELRRYRGGDE